MTSQGTKILLSFILAQVAFAALYWIFPVKDPREKLWQNLENKKFSCLLIQFEPGLTTKDVKTLSAYEGNYKVGLWHMIYSDTEHVVSFALRDAQNIQITILDIKTNNVKAIAASSALVQELFLLYQPLNWKVSCQSSL